MVSDILVFTAGALLGILGGMAAFLFYMRYRTRKQLQQMEDQMGEMFDVPDELEQE